MVIEVEGGSKAAGELTIQGAKNAVLPMIAATVLCRESVVLEGCPKIRDVDAMTSILEEIGADVTWDGGRLVIHAASADRCEISGKAAGEVRASVLFLGSMLGRNQEGGICLPGGCSIGARPVDYHVAAFEKLGASVVQKDGKICCAVERAGEEVVELPYPSVGATENVILFSVLRGGRTELRNAAKEPEIVELHGGSSVRRGEQHDFDLWRKTASWDDIPIKIRSDRVSDLCCYGGGNRRGGRVSCVWRYVSAGKGIFGTGGVSGGIHTG